MQATPTYTAVNAKLRIPYIVIIALSTWAALGIQFYITTTNHPADRSLAGVVVQFFSYFTIITNILVAVTLSMLLLAPGSKAGKFFGQPAVITAITVYISVVGLVYALMLRSVWSPTEGLAMLSNEILHTTTPLLYLLFWLIFVNKSELKWSSPLRWLWLPGIYVLYITLRGIASGMYPYPFIDVSSIGYLKAITNTFILLLVFLGFGVLFISIGKNLAQKQR